MASKYTLQIQSGALKGTIIALDATTEISQTYSGKATENPTANRSSVSDHFISNNPVFMFKGVVSGVYNPNDPIKRDTNETVDKYKSTIENASLVTFFSGQSRAEENCFVERISLTRNPTTGLLGWNLSATLNKINIATGGKESLINIIPDQSTSKTNISASSTKKKCEVFQLEGVDSVAPNSEFGKKTYTTKC